MTRRRDWPARETTISVPLIGSGFGETVYGKGDRVWGSRIVVTEMERESRERSPEKGEDRERRAEPWMTEVVKSR